MRSTSFRSPLLRLLKFLQIKKWEPNFCVVAILQKVWIIWSPFLYFNLKTFKDQNSFSFVTFQSALYDSEELLSDFWNLCKLKSGVLISGGNQFCRKSELFGTPFIISNLKLSRTQILRHSLDFNAFCMIQEKFCQKFQISRN